MRDSSRLINKKAKISQNNGDIMHTSATKSTEVFRKALDGSKRFVGGKKCYIQRMEDNDCQMKAVGCSDGELVGYIGEEQLSSYATNSYGEAFGELCDKAFATRNLMTAHH